MEFDIIISIYFSGVLNKENIKKLIDYSVYECHEIYGKELDGISYTFLKDNIEKDKYLKFNAKNLKKFDNYVDEGVLKSFEVYNLSDNYSYKSRDNDISLNYNSENEFTKQGWITLQLNGSFGSVNLNTIRLKGIVDYLISLLINQNIKIMYGFVFPMERNKNPKFFAIGLGSEHLTKEEEIQTFIWGNNQNLCGEKIWDIFWGNIITTNHLVDSFSEKKLIKIFGKENIISKWERLYICYLPTDIMLFKNEKSNKYKEKIKKIFLKHDIIIKV